nr:uncharacterized protein LOC124807479 [Hydra vulgaris]
MLDKKVLYSESTNLKLKFLSYSYKTQSTDLSKGNPPLVNIEESPSSNYSFSRIPDKDGVLIEPSFQDYLDVFYLYLKSLSGGKKDSVAAHNEMKQIMRMMQVVSPQEPCYTKFFDLQNLAKVWQSHVVKKGYEPGTQRSYLLSFTHFIEFLIRSKPTQHVDNVLLVNISVCSSIDSNEENDSD